MNSQFSAEQFNTLFMTALSSNNAEVMSKTAAASGLYIQMKLRENSFFRQILTPKTITPEECVREENSENLYYIDDLEPDSIAMRINWRSQPSQHYITGYRVKYGFTTVGTPEFTKTEKELRSWRAPLTKIIEQNCLKDIQEEEDKSWMEHTHAGIFLATRWRYNELVRRGVVSGTYNFASEAEFYRYLFKKNKGSGAWTTPIPPNDLRRADGYFSNIILSDQPIFNKDCISELSKILSNRQLKPRVVLMHESTWLDHIKWGLNDAGLTITSEIVVDGYKHRTVGGLTYITTLRDNPDIINPGCIYIFPDEEFLGKFLVMEQTKFWIKKEADTVLMRAWEEVGGGFGNVRGLGVLLLIGARIPLWVSWQDNAHLETAQGKLWVINDPSMSSLPALI